MDGEYQKALYRIKEAKRLGATILNLSSLELTIVPPEIGQLTSLTMLNLGGNQLTAVPSEIVKLTSLTTLWLHGNWLTAVPPEIGQLTNLTVLDLRANRLMVVPPEIGQLTSLTRLYLGGNQLTAVPPEIGQLTNLQTFNLGDPSFGGNKITELPLEIWQLTSLTELDLDGNHLTVVPPEMGKLSSLTTLRLNHNEITVIPANMRKLTSLTVLGLSQNQLTAVPSEIGQLTSLTEFDLSFNELTTVPSEIGQLTSLTKLDLRDNQLTQLPDSLQQLTQLTDLNLLFNPALGIPPEVLEQRNNPALILQTYFAARHPLHEAKLLLVGQGRVGKTSLLRRLIDGSFNANEATTHGINVRLRSIALPDGTNVRLNIWDFGGQEIMHNTHQFFLTQRSLYLILLNAREDIHANRLDYWLKLVGNLADAPIIIIANQIDQNPAFSLDERELRYQYPNIVAFARADCFNFRSDNQAGFAALEAKIAHALADHLPHIHDRFPQAFFNIKAQLEQMKTTTIQFAAYQAMCQQQGIENEQLQRGYMRVLHELGVVLNYQDDPYLAQFGIMNRNWVVQGVYAIITTKLLADSRGKLHRHDLPAIFAACANVDEADYPPAAHTLILDMMEKFELCYPFDRDNYFVPDLFDKNTPDTINFHVLTADSLAFRYQFTALPSSIFSRFLVRRHKLADPERLWRDGAVLQRDGQTAFIRATPDAANPAILINITGPGDRRLLLEIIRSTFEELFPPKMAVAEMVPLPQNTDITLSYAALRKMAARNITEHFVAEIDDFINPAQLLGVVEWAGRQSRRQTDDAASSGQNIYHINIGGRTSVGDISNSSGVAVGDDASANANSPKPL